MEVALIKHCCPAMEPARDGILDRIRVLEKKVEDSLAGISQEGLKALAGAAGAYGAGFPGNAAGFGSGEEAQAEPPMTDAVPEDVELVVKNWYSIVNQSHPSLKVMLKDAKLKALGENRLGILARNSLAEESLKQTDHIAQLEELIEKRIQRKIQIQVASAQTDPNKNVGVIDFEKIIHMDIEEEED